MLDFTALLGGKDKLLELAKNHLTQEFIENLKRGSTLVPASFLEEKIREGLADEPDADVESILFSETGLTINLAASKLGLKVVVPMTVTVGAIELSAQNQTVRVLVKVDKAAGDGFISRTICLLAGEMISRVIAEKISQLPVVVSVKERAGGGREIVVDLGGLAAVKKLATPVAFGKSALDLLTVGKVVHRADGLLVHLGLGPMLQGMFGRAPDAAPAKA